MAPYVDYQWDVDTANMDYYKKDNDGFAYFLLAIDVLSKYIWTVALRTRTGKEMKLAFAKILALARKFTNVRSNKGTEFANEDGRRYFKDQAVNYFVTQNVVKASYVKRAIKTIKSCIIRYITHSQHPHWVDVLPDITESYNKTYHPSITRRPASVKSKDSVELWKIQYETKPRLKETLSYGFKIGDLVRVSYI